MSNDEEDDNSSIEETSEDDDEAEKSEKNHFEDLRSSEAYKTLCEDFEPEVVLASLIECGTQDIDDLTGWCLSDHLDDQVQDILKGHLLRMKIDSSSATESDTHERARMQRKSAIVKPLNPIILKKRGTQS